MTLERVVVPAVEPGLPASGTGEGAPAADTPDSVKLQILATEHWSLLATRSMGWNESFSRAGMFLSVLSGAVVALALVAQATAFGEGFVVFALLLLPVVLFVGVTTFLRLGAVNNEDARLVLGMNRLRRAYTEVAPGLAPYFITGTTEDERGMILTFGTDPRQSTFVSLFASTPGMLVVIDGVIAGVIAGLVAVVLGWGTVVAVGVGTVVFFAALVAFFAYSYRAFQRAQEWLAEIAARGGR